jgi:iron complex outermembrane recepter protein
MGRILGLACMVVALSAAGQERTLDEVVVTAQRREQSLQEVPVSVTAFGGAQLERGNTTEAAEYLSLTPNVSFTEDGQTGSRGLGVSIRGVSSMVTGENAFTNSVGVYFNGLSVASVPNQVLNPQLSDMERVEVLRGPQGTYFGRNALAGVVNLTPRKPTNSVEAALGVGAEFYDDANDMLNVTGIFNVPVNDTLRMRAVGFYEDSGGLVENICAAGASGCPRYREFVSGNLTTPSGTPDSGHEQVMARMILEWVPSDTSRTELTLVYSDEDQGHDENVPTGVLDLDTIDTFGVTVAIDPLTGLPAAPGAPGLWPNNRNRLAHDLDERNENESAIAILTFSRRIAPDTELTSITGLIDAEHRRLFDQDVIAAADIARRSNVYTGLSWSTELRLEIAKDRFEWVVGGLYAEDDQEQEIRIRIGENADALLPVAPNVVLLPPVPTPFGPAMPVGLCAQCNDKNYEVQSLAFFTDFSWHQTERLDLVFGGRYTNDDVLNEMTYATTLDVRFDPTLGGPVFFNPLRPPVSHSQSFRDFSPRFSAFYRFTDTFSGFATVSKGYKAGGTSVGHFGNTPAAVPFDEETLRNVEIGFKSELLDRRVRFNGALFDSEWRDLQLENFRFLVPGDLSSLFEETTNVDSADAYGLELEVLALVTDRLTFSGGVGRLETEITCACRATLTGGYVVDLKGLTLPKSPELTVQLAGEYRLPLADGEAWFRLEYVRRDGQYSDIEAVTTSQTRGKPAPNSGLVAPPLVDGFPFRTPDYDVVNLRAGWERGRIGLDFYAQNLLDEEYFTGTQENFGLGGVRVRPHPRTLGFGVTYHFAGTGR